MVQQHTTLGYKLLVPLQIPQMLTEAILSHHENYDGSGYPEGLKGEVIPLIGRLIRIVDYYDALTSYRSYRPKTIYSPTEALDVLRQNRHCFDLSLLDAFVDLVETEL
jgi:HD-GYP domain-containing protein (c-di-GMP phosphodiesterase class II)